MITAEDFEKAAASIGCEVAAIRAVDIVESRGKGFTSHKGKQVPVILLEPHHLYKRSGRYPLSRDFPHLSARSWEEVRRRKLYNDAGRELRTGEDRQHVKLDQAISLDAHYHTGTDELKKVAWESCSWGRFQVMGFNWQSLGYPSIYAFVEVMYRSEGDHLDSLVRFIRGNGLAPALRKKNWRAFAAIFNGPGYAENNYDSRLKIEYDRLTKIAA